MPKTLLKPVWIAVSVCVVVLLALLGEQLVQREGDTGKKTRDKQPVPIEVADIYKGDLALSRTFSGTIYPYYKFVASAKVSGRVERLRVDIGDHVSRGQLIAQLEDAEFKQAVIEAEARLAVAEANCIEAESHLKITQRELDRTKALHRRGITSDSGLDSAKTEILASQAAVKVAEANRRREDAALEAARIRLGYTQIQAGWQRGDEGRTIAERYVDEGDTVAANTQLFSIVELDPVMAVIQITEKDYPLVVVGQQAVLRTDAFSERMFAGEVSRIAPIFHESSRQARIEIRVSNPDRLLKPGMFTRCTLELKQVKDTTSVPEMAITRRNNRDGIFWVTEDGNSVKWIEVDIGLQTNELVEIGDISLSGKVVILGQQFLNDNSSVRISDSHLHHGSVKLP